MASTELWTTSALDHWGNQIFIDSKGYIHIVGTSGFGSGIDIYYAISTDEGITFTDGEGGTGSSYKTIATNINIPNDWSPPAIVVDSNDNIYVFWGDDTDNELYFRKKTGGTGGTWDSIISISDIVGKNYYVTYPLRVEIDSDDNIIIGTASGYTFQLFTSIDSGSNWSYQEASSSYKFQNMCLGYDGHLWAIFFGGTGSKYSYIRKITKTEGSPDTWSIGVRTQIGGVASSTLSLTESSIICERDSETVWAFRIDTNGIHYIKYEGGSWNNNWTQISATTGYYELSPICTYINQIYLFARYYQYGNPRKIYYLKYNGSSWEDAIDTGITDPYSFTVAHPRNLVDTDNYIGFTFINSSSEAYFDRLELPLELSDTINLSDNILVNLSLEKIELSDTINLSDNIYLKLTAEELIEGETITLNDEIQASYPVFKEDTINLSDEIYVNTPQEQIILNDTINLSDNILDWKDIINDFRIVKGVIEDIPNDFRSVVESIDDVTNVFSMAYAGDLTDIKNDIRYMVDSTYDITNDFRMLKSWQIPGDAGFQSLGKEYIKIYINGSADDDVDINSVTINKILNSAHTANFVIGRPYDTTNKPTIEHEVEIRYYEKNWTDYCLLYKGYITGIIPGDTPESIKINCQDKYWIRNREKKYFYVGHKPSDNHELYYEQISEALSICGFNGTGIGNFVPQTMNLFGRGESDSISSLITNSGNYAWFYDVDGTKKLWTAGEGSIINLERQEPNKNIGLYQVLQHSLTESIDNLINRFRVTMGDKVIRRFNDYGGSKEYDGYYYYLDEEINLIPAWDSSLEILAKDSDDGYGFDKHPTEENDKYADVYTKYIIPFTSTDLEAYTDRFEPRIIIEAPIGGTGLKSSIGVKRGVIGNNILSTTITGGFTIDYKNRTITFGERTFLYTEDENDEMDSTRTPVIRLNIWKQKFISRTDNPSDNPQDSEDITSPLVFITDKMGDYPETVWGSLQLSGLGIQYGGWYISGYDENDQAIWKYIPSWNDIPSAQDYANWKLSQTCDKKIQGSITVTIDTICYYNIDLAKRIMIDGILENPLNIKSITYNLNNFTVNLELENNRYYQRTISIQPRGV